MSNLRIERIRTVTTSPGKGSIQKRLVVVVVETSEPGLTGLGCATFTQRHSAVACVVEEFLDPLLRGRDPHRIEDIWKTVHVNAYWRSGPVMNNALSGVDMALWDIKGKIAGLPVYQLFGGKCREGVPVYRHAGGQDPAAVTERVRGFLAEGARFVRAQMGGYGGRVDRVEPPSGSLPGAYFDPDAYLRATVRLFGHLRSELGDEVELLHDVHERLPPIQAVRLAKELEPFRLFYLEDLFPPEQLEWFRLVRGQCATPLAMGELFTNPKEWQPLIEGRLIDFIRCHISSIGGLTPARKLAVLCEQFGIRTAWHGPGDVSPVGHAANVHLGLASPNVGVQEWAGIADVEGEIFPGAPEVRDGYVYANDRPGLGVELNEALAGRFPCPDGVLDWTQARTPDGTITYP